MGKHLVKNLLMDGHNITIANRGRSKDEFGNKVSRILFERTDERSIKEALSSQQFDLIFDSLAYCSNDIKILLDHVSCDRYVTISTTAVYRKHIDTKECEFNPLAEKVIWCSRSEFPYDESKRQAERALAQAYPSVSSVAVRFPFVIGEDDYTNRLYFYVEHIMAQKPMYVDNFKNQMAFVRSDEAGKFLSLFAQNEFQGTINGASSGTVSIQDIAEYIKMKTGKEAILSQDGETAPYNGEKEYSINTDKANELGFYFTPLHQWIFDLLDYCIDRFHCIQ